MNSLFPVTIFGLLLVASGSVRNKEDLWGDDQQLDVADYEVLNKGSLEVYRRIAERRKFDNIAVAPVDTLVLLFGIYSNPNGKSLSGFFNSFEPDKNATAIKKYASIGRLAHISLIELSMGHISARGVSCLSDRTEDYRIFDEKLEMYYSNLQNLFPHVEQWYRDMNIDVSFHTGEFGGAECVIGMGANSFRHTWQQHKRCVLQSKFSVTKDTLRDGVKFTHMISDLRYGELPEVNARYIVVPWSIPERLAANIELYVILPNSVDGLRDVETGITDTIIQRMANETRRGRVEAILPEIRVTRKYHPVPMMRRVSENPFPDSRLDLVKVAKFDVFRANAYDCYLSPEIKSTKKSDVPFFIADHPFLILFLQRTPLAKRSLISGMLTYRTPEQAND